MAVHGGGFRGRYADNIHDRGEIACQAFDPNGNLHACLLVSATAAEIATAVNLPVASAAPKSSRWVVNTSADSPWSGTGYQIRIAASDENHSSSPFSLAVMNSQVTKSRASRCVKTAAGATKTGLLVAPGDCRTDALARSLVLVCPGRRRLLALT